MQHMQFIAMKQTENMKT